MQPAEVRGLFAALEQVSDPRGRLVQPFFLLAYGITSAGRDRADAEMLLEWQRGHWGIENKEHWVRDKTFGEDHCLVRTDSAPQVLAGIRTLSMNWLRILHAARNCVFRKPVEL